MTPEQVGGLVALVDWASRLSGTAMMVLFGVAIWRRWFVPEWFVVYLLDQQVRIIKERDDALAMARGSTHTAGRVTDVAEQLASGRGSHDPG